jgi:hypothetical protein
MPFKRWVNSETLSGAAGAVLAAGWGTGRWRTGEGGGAAGASDAAGGDGEKKESKRSNVRSLNFIPMQMCVVTRFFQNQENGEKNRFTEDDVLENVDRIALEAR